MHGYVTKQSNASDESIYDTIKAACSCGGAGAKINEATKWVKTHTVLLAVVAGVVLLLMGVGIAMLFRSSTPAPYYAPYFMRPSPVSPYPASP